MGDKVIQCLKSKSIDSSRIEIAMINWMKTIRRKYAKCGIELTTNQMWFDSFLFSSPKLQTWRWSEKIECAHTQGQRNRNISYLPKCVSMLKPAKWNGVIVKKHFSLEFNHRLLSRRLCSTEKRHWHHVEIRRKTRVNDGWRRQRRWKQATKTFHQFVFRFTYHSRKKYVRSSNQFN